MDNAFSTQFFTASESQSSDFAPDAAHVLPNTLAHSALPAALPTFAASEPTQQILWLLPSESRLRVTRGGRTRDWKPWLTMLAGIGAVCLLMVTLFCWPHSTPHLPPAAPTFPAATEFDRTSSTAASRSSSLTIAAASALGGMPAYSNTPAVPYPGLHYERRPVPGYAPPQTYSSRRAYVPANVLPAAPTAIGMPVVRYSY